MIVDKLGKKESKENVNIDKNEWLYFYSTSNLKFYIRNQNINRTFEQKIRDIFKDNKIGTFYKNTGLIQPKDNYNAERS